MAARGSSRCTCPTSRAPLPRVDVGALRYSVAMGMAGGAADASDSVPPTGPAPGGRALTATVECRTSRSAIHGEPHGIIIRTDWSVQTPHDLDAERVGMAKPVHRKVDSTTAARSTAIPLSFPWLVVPVGLVVTPT